MLCNLCHGQSLEQRKNFFSIFKLAASQLANYKRMADNTSVQQKLFESWLSIPKMRYPNWRVNQNHSYLLFALLLGIGRSFFSVPPNLASLLLLSRAMMASKPSLTKEVFSLTPVNWDASSISLSSIIMVVLICMNMHKKCIFVKTKNTLLRCFAYIISWNLKIPSH